MARAKDTAAVGRALEALRAGRPAVLINDARRDGGVSLTLPAEMATEESIAFLVRHTSGMVSVGLTSPRLQVLGLSPSESSGLRGGGDLSVDIGDGPSARARAKTIRSLADARTEPTELRTPGHVFPRRVRAKGILARTDDAEASVDLARLAGFEPVAAYAQLVDDRGSLLRHEEDAEALAREHGLPVVRVLDLIRYRHSTEVIVERVISAELPTLLGEFEAQLYRSAADGLDHVALVRGTFDESDVLTYVHFECLTGDVFRSQLCDCRARLDAALKKIEARGTGVVLYLRASDARGSGLVTALRTYALEARGLNRTMARLELGLPADDRDFAAGAQILAQLGVEQVSLLSDDPMEKMLLTDCGIRVARRLPLLGRARSKPDHGTEGATQRSDVAGREAGAGV